MTSKQYRGFTLIEVLVALVIIALSLSAAMKTTGDISGSSFHLRQKVFAHWVAQNRLAELTLMEKPPGKGVKKDTVEMVDQEWEWTQTISETPYKDIFKIEIDVKLADADDESGSLITLVSYTVNPALISNATLALVSNVDPTKTPDSRKPDDGNERDRNNRQRRNEVEEDQELWDQDERGNDRRGDFDDEYEQP